MTRIKLDEVQTISGADGRPTHAVVPWPIWSAIAEAIEGDEALFRGVDPEEETFPADVARRLVEGESAIKVFREYRRLTQAQLAERVGSTPAYISQIENAARRAGDDLLRKIARALDVDYDDIALPALPAVADIVGQPVTWNGEREIVSCILSVDGNPRMISVSLEALEDLERVESLTDEEAIGAFERNRERIREATARAVAEGRRQRDGVLLLVSADF